MTKASVTVDPKGFLGDSFYVSSLNERVQQTPPYDEAACAEHLRHHLRHDSSKRPQARGTSRVEADDQPPPLAA